MARLEGQGHTGLHDCPRPRSDARRRARRKTDRPHVTADPVGRGHCDPRSLMNAEQVQPNMPRALHKKSWAVIDRPYSLGCATVGALYERPRCIFCAKSMQREATRAFPRFVKKSKDDFSDLRGVKFSRRFRTSTATRDAACAGLQSPTA